VRIVRAPAAVGKLTASWQARGERVGFVPTMGALHAAHLSLVRRAAAECGKVLVSVFVNPMQFGPKEDFSRYPRPFREDAALCRRAGVDALYHPHPRSMYPPGFDTAVDVGRLSRPLCGKQRPGHFRGVATVVLKLLLQVQPDRLYLGEKDFQQLAVVRRMARDLDLPVRVVGCPTKREPDGLAISSRNVYLTPGQRGAAPDLHKALVEGKRLAESGTPPPQVVARVRRRLSSVPDARLEYIELVDASTLESPNPRSRSLRLLGALWFGRTRLIDNVPVKVG